LTGGHAIGIGHCSSFSNGLYPTQDMSVEESFAQRLYKTCPTNTTNNTTVLDIRSPNKFDNKYTAVTTLGLLKDILIYIYPATL